MNKETGLHARKSSLYSLSHREKLLESQPHTPSSKTKASSSVSRDQSINSAQKLPEETPVAKPQQDSNTAVRPQSSSAKQAPYKQHKRSTSDAHLNIYAGSPKLDRDVKSIVSPRSVKDRSSVLKRLVEPSNKGPSTSSINIIQAKRYSQGSMPPSFCSESNTKKGSRPEIQGKEQESEPLPLKGIIFQDLKKRLSAQEKVIDTPKSKMTQQTPKNSFSTSLAKHKYGEYSPKIAPRSIVKDLSPRKRISIGMNEPGSNTHKGIKAHDKGLSAGQMYIFTTEAEDKDKEGKKGDKDKQQADHKEPFGLYKSRSEDKSSKNNSEQDQEKEKEKARPAPKNAYERTLESDLANYKILLDSNKQTFQFEKMMLEGRKARKGISFLSGVGDAIAKKEQNGAQVKALDMAGLMKNNPMQETCLSANVKNPSTLDRLLSAQRPATCNTPRVENGDRGEKTGSSKENSDFERLEKLLEAQEKAKSGSLEVHSETKGI